MAVFHSMQPAARSTNCTTSGTSASAESSPSGASGPSRTGDSD